MREPISFNQVRDFGGLFNATFEFLRQEFKPFGKMLLIYALPVAFVATIIVSYATYMQLDVMIGEPQSTLGSNYILSTLLSAFTSLLIYFIFSLISYSYLAAYIKMGANNFTTSDVLSIAKSKWLLLLAINIVYVIASFIGLIILVIPGIYLSILLYFAAYAYFTEDTSFRGSFKRSIDVVTDNWWFSFGFILVFYLMISIASSIFYVPFMIVGIIKAATAYQNGGDLGALRMVMVVATGLLTVVKGAMMMVVVIASQFLFCSLVKKKYDPELEQLINKVTSSQNESI